MRPCSDLSRPDFLWTESGLLDPMMSGAIPLTVADPLIEAFMADVDRSLLRENLKLTVEQRLRQLHGFQESVLELQRAGKEARRWNQPQ